MSDQQIGDPGLPSEDRPGGRPDVACAVLVAGPHPMPVRRSPYDWLCPAASVPDQGFNVGGILRRTAIPSIATRGSDVRDPEFPERMGLTAFELLLAGRPLRKRLADPDPEFSLSMKLRGPVGASKYFVARWLLGLGLCFSFVIAIVVALSVPHDLAAAVVVFFVGYFICFCLSLSRVVSASRAGRAFYQSRSQPFSVLQLGPGQFLLSPDTYFKLTMRRDGDLVVSPPNGQPLWRSHTRGHPGARAVMQVDGNFIILEARGSPLWATATEGNPGAGLALQDDGNLLVYSESGQILWQSKTRNAGLRERTRRDRSGW